MPKNYVVVVDTDKKVLSLVSSAFSENRGKLPLKELTRILMQKVKYAPLEEFAENNPQT